MKIFKFSLAVYRNHFMSKSSWMLHAAEAYFQLLLH